MIRAYLEFAKRSFQNNVTYRVDYFAGVINVIIMIFVNISIWKAISEEEGAIGSIQLSILITYFVLSFIMQCIFTMDEYVIENKVRSGLISSDLLKPISFKAYIFSYHIGTLMFRCTMQLIPVLVISIILFRILPPFSVLAAVYFFVSAVLGYLLLYNLNFIIWISSFWFYWTFSLVTLKDAAIMIFSGALLPIWYFPKWLSDIIYFTPFDSIYYIPVSIYLGQIPMDEIISALIRQAIWIIVLYGIGHVLWKASIKRLVVQGG